MSAATLRTFDPMDQNADGTSDENAADDADGSPA